LDEGSEAFAHESVISELRNWISVRLLSEKHSPFIIAGVILATKKHKKHKRASADFGILHGSFDLYNGM
jgi:hypothetical protein